MCLILNGYRDRAVWMSTPNNVRFLFSLVGSELFHAEGRTDRHDEPNSRFSHFCERAVQYSNFIVYLLQSYFNGFNIPVNLDTIITV
jgi:hypothetical protein